MSYEAADLYVNLPRSFQSYLKGGLEVMDTALNISPATYLLPIGVNKVPQNQGEGFVQCDVMDVPQDATLGGQFMGSAVAQVAVWSLKGDIRTDRNFYYGQQVAGYIRKYVDGNSFYVSSADGLNGFYAPMRVKSVHHFDPQSYATLSLAQPADNYNVTALTVEIVLAVQEN